MSYRPNLLTRLNQLPDGEGMSEVGEPSGGIFPRQMDFLMHKSPITFF
jgi:hypothetical protein